MSKEKFEILGLDHVAIAVEDLDRASAAWSRVLDCGDPERERVDSEKVEVAFYPLPGADVELITPAGEQSPIDSFLKKRGEGIHHICLRVSDAGAAWKRFREQGLPLLGEGPHEGAGGAKIFFLHPKAVGGVLVEFREVPEA